MTTQQKLINTDIEQNSANRVTSNIDKHAHAHTHTLHEFAHPRSPIAHSDPADKHCSFKKITGLWLRKAAAVTCY